MLLSREHLIDIVYRRLLYDIEELREEIAYDGNFEHIITDVISNLCTYVFDEEYEENQLNPDLNRVEFEREVEKQTFSDIENKLTMETSGKCDKSFDGTEVVVEANGIIIIDEDNNEKATICVGWKNIVDCIKEAYVKSVSSFEKKYGSNNVLLSLRVVEGDLTNDTIIEFTKNTMDDIIEVVSFIGSKLNDVDHVFGSLYKTDLYSLCNHDGLGIDSKKRDDLFNNLYYRIGELRLHVMMELASYYGDCSYEVEMNEYDSSQTLISNNSKNPSYIGGIINSLQGKIMHVNELLNIQRRKEELRMKKVPVQQKRTKKRGKITK